MKYSLLATKYIESLSKKNLLAIEHSFLSNKIFKKEINKIKVLRSDVEISKELNKNYKYLYKLYRNLINCSKNKLNSIHKINKSYRYWDSIIGKWVYRFLIISFVKWSAISQALQKYQIKEVIYTKSNFKKFIPSDYTEFVLYLNNFFWHSMVINDIINFKKKNIKFITINNNNLKKKNFIINNYYKDSNFLIKLFDKILAFKKKTNIFLFKTYFGKINNLCLFLKNKTIPRLYTEFEKKIIISSKKIKANRKNIELDFNHNNQFELFLKKNILKYIPVSYLEGFNKINTYCNQINLEAKNIYSATGHVNDIFSIWSANKIEEGSKYIFSEHGGNLDSTKEFGSFSDRYDVYLSWKKSKNKKVKQIKPFYYTKKNINCLNIGKKLGIVTSTPNRFIFYFTTHLTGGESLEAIEDLQILKKLPYHIRKELIFRLHPNYKFWSSDRRIIKNFGSKHISRSSDLNSFFKESKIIVNMDFLTGFHQSMNTGKPVVVYFKKKLLKTVDKDIKKLIFKLKKENIVFSDNKKLFKHILNIWDEPYLWWNSKRILNARKQFQKVCSLDSSNYQFRKKISELNI